MPYVVDEGPGLKEPAVSAEGPKIARPRSPALGIELRGLEGGQRQSRLAARVDNDLAFIIEEHRRATAGIVSRPIRQAFVVRIPIPRESDPGAAHLVFQRVAIIAVAGHWFPNIHIVENEGDLQRVKRLQL